MGVDLGRNTYIVISVAGACGDTPHGAVKVLGSPLEGFKSIRGPARSLIMEVSCRSISIAVDGARTPETPMATHGQTGRNTARW